MYNRRVKDIYIDQIVLGFFFHFKIRIKKKRFYQLRKCYYSRFIHVLINVSSDSEAESQIPNSSSFAERSSKGAYYM